MKPINDTSISRRSFVSLAAAGSSLLFLPTIAFAQEGEESRGEPADIDNQNTVAEGEVFAHPELSINDFDAMLQEQAEEEVAQFLAQKEEEISTKAGNYTYQTVYGTPLNVSTGYKYCSNQPSNGTKIAGGGSININTTGGPTVSISVTFPLPYGSFSVGCATGSKVGVGGVSVYIPSNGYYKVRVNNTYRTTPYVVYEIVKSTGSKRMISRGHSKYLYSSAYDKVKVG